MQHFYSQCSKSTAIELVSYCSRHNIILMHEKCNAHLVCSKILRKDNKINAYFCYFYRRNYEATDNFTRQAD